jgi:hypothetical protein
MVTRAAPGSQSIVPGRYWPCSTAIYPNEPPPWSEDSGVELPLDPDEQDEPEDPDEPEDSEGPALGFEPEPEELAQLPSEEPPEAWDGALNPPADGPPR